jgi:hypothetical protein
MTDTSYRLANLYIAVELSDSDESLANIAQQCGYDVMHPAVVDVAEPATALWHEQPCLCVRLTLSSSALALASAMPDVSTLTCRLSHPAIASYQVLALSELG